MQNKIRRIAAPAGYGDDIKRLFEPHTRLVKHDVLRSIQQVHDALHRAEKDADTIRHNAEKERRDNIENWKREASEEAQQEIVETVIKAQRKYDNAIRDAEQDLVTLAIQIADKIVGDAITFDPAIVADLVAQKLVTLQSTPIATVTTHPDDLPLLEKHREALQNLAGARIQFASNENIKRGGCVIDTELGRIDGRIETQLENIKKSMEQP